MLYINLLGENREFYVKSDIWAPPYSQNGMILTPREYSTEIGSRIGLLLSKHRIVDYSGSPLNFSINNMNGMFLLRCRSLIWSSQKSKIYI